MPHQQFSLPGSFDRSQIAATGLHKHLSTKPELKYGVLRHQQLFRRQGVSQRLNKGQYFNLKPDGRTSSERTESPLNVLPKIKRQSLNIRSARPDKVRISLKMRRFF